MNKITKTLLIILLFILIPIILFQLVPQASFEHKEVDFSTDVSSLSQAFDNNETEANKRYLGKVVEVSGVIVDAFKDEDDSWVALLGVEGSDAPLVMSTFDNNISDKSQLAIGKIITVKGQCTGKLMEVVLNKASIVLLK